MMRGINSISVDSSQSLTDMCRLGTEFPTDKSPFSKTMHRHPYTAIYDALFSPLRYNDILFGEVGILDNMSMYMWRSYFTRARLIGFEYLEDRLTKAKTDALSNTQYYFADVSDCNSLRNAFNAANGIFDVLIDDSTHLFDHQINFINTAIDFVKPGGFLIVEDIFKHWPNKRYEDALANVLKYFSSSYFIEASHRDGYSGGNTQEPYFDNDKLLVLMRNQKPREIVHPQKAANLARLPVD